MHNWFGRSRAALAITSAAAIAALGLTGVASATPASISPAVTSAAATSPARIVIQGGYQGTASPLGRDQAGSLSLTFTLQAQHGAELQSTLAAQYQAGSPSYHHWLSTAQFNARFAPSAAQRAAVAAYLRTEGLTVTAGSSPFLLTVTGSPAAVDAALHTTVESYRENGVTFHSIATAASLPRGLTGIVQSVLGLTSVGARHAQYKIAPRPKGSAKPAYGAGPDQSGLTPSQTIGLNNGAKIRALGAKGEGRSTTLAVFELSGYTQADITTWWKRFYGNAKMPRLVDINSDGGPVTPNCPAGDECGPIEAQGDGLIGLDSADYSGDIEVEADIETLLSLDPKANRIDVYNAPNDLTGQTGVAEYDNIAQQNAAGVVSVSWGQCEAAATSSPSTSGLVQAEETAFEEMAAQGQSIFASAGDDGAYDCIGGTPSTDNPAVDDPASDPYVTGVGGTSYEAYDPQTNKHPGYPTGVPTVWNPLGLCGPNQNSDAGACAIFGAGGGGDSSVWAAPSWQKKVPGVRNRQSSYTCGAKGTSLCREVPDVSANADEYTPYAEYCTGAGATGAAAGNPIGYPGDSTCTVDLLDAGSPAWFGIGGTSLASPLWAGVFGEADGYHGRRQGLASEELYGLDRASKESSTYFYDIVGTDKVEVNNGLYNTTRGYDQATGIGTPNIDTLVPALK